MKALKVLFVLLFTLSTSACNLPSSPVVPPATQVTLSTPVVETATGLPPSETSLPATDLPQPTETPAIASDTPVSITEVAPTSQADPRGEEAILILEPGPGSRLVGSIHVSGEADSTFEQHLGINLVLDDGTVLATVPVIIQAELGQRGPFEVDIPFTVSEERQGFIQVFDTSARDGGILHLASVGVLLAPEGTTTVVPVELHPERIEIFAPSLGAAVSGGVAHVEGFALASFEQGLLVQVLDVDGNVVGQQAVTVAAQELGQPGPFSTDVPYNVTAVGPGRIVVRDISPAFGGDTHVASVEVELQP